MAAAAIAFLFWFGDWDRAGAAFRYAGYYGWKGDEIVFTKYTPYHKIEVVKARGGEHRLLLNGKRQFGGDPTRAYAYFVAEYPARLLGKPTVALLGCGSMATVGRIGDFVPRIAIVDLDAEVFGAARTFFQSYNRLDQLHNWTFTADDAKHWLASTDESFDLVLHDIPPARSRQIALTYTDEFFRLVKARLTPRGIFSISSLTPFSRDSHYGKRMVKTLASVFDRYFVLVRQGSLYFYGGGPELVVPDQAALREALDGHFRSGVQVRTKAEIDAQVEGESTITVSNVGDLIYD
jgi:spermidine synthase